MAPISTQHATLSLRSTYSSTPSTSSHVPLILGLELWKYLAIVFATFAVVLLLSYVLWIRPSTQTVPRDILPVSIEYPSPSKKSSPDSSQFWRLISPKSWRASPPLTTPSPSSSFGCKDALAVTRFHLAYPGAVHDPLASPTGLFNPLPSPQQAGSRSFYGLFDSNSFGSSTSSLPQYSPARAPFSRNLSSSAPSPTSLSPSSHAAFDRFGIPILPLPNKVPDCSDHDLWNNPKLSPVCGSLVSSPSSSTQVLSSASIPASRVPSSSPASTPSDITSTHSSSRPSIASSTRARRCLFFSSRPPPGPLSIPFPPLLSVKNKSLPPTPYIPSQQNI